MGRARRVDAAGTTHHVVARGVDRQAIVFDDLDRQNFLEHLAASAQRTGTSVLAWALLDNHYHLIVRSEEARLPAFAHRLGSGYARRVNARHGRSGHLFQGRYFSRALTEDEEWMTALRYVLRNPFKHGAVDRIEALRRHPWTAIPSLIAPTPLPFHRADLVLARFDDDEGRARERCWQWLKEDGDRTAARVPRAVVEVHAYLGQVCRRLGTSLDQLALGRRTPEDVRARSVAAALAIERGYAPEAVAEHLSLSRRGLRAAALRGRRTLDERPELVPPGAWHRGGTS